MEWVAYLASRQGQETEGLHDHRYLYCIFERNMPRRLCSVRCAFAFNHPSEFASVRCAVTSINPCSNCVYFSVGLTTAFVAGLYSVPAGRGRLLITRSPWVHSCVYAVLGSQLVAGVCAVRRSSRGFDREPRRIQVLRE